MQISNLKKSFDDKVVLNGVNLDIAPGEVVCVMGGSGSGKTTVLNAVAGLLPYEGEVTPVEVSYIFQTDRLIPGISVRKNLEFVMGETLTSQEKAEKITRLLDRAGLSGTENMLPSELSGGMAQRVSFVRAFLAETDVVLMDEPFRSLDVSTKRVMGDLFFRLLNDSNKSVLFVTHDVDEALYFGDKIAVLKGGVIAREIVNPEPRGNRKFFQADESIRRILFNEFTE